MGRYIATRLLLMIPTLFGIMLITFAVTQFVPGGPVEQLIHQLESAGQQGEVGSGRSELYQGEKGLDPEMVQQLNEYYGFDKPVHVRFADMIGNYLRFDFGESYSHNRSVTTLIIDRLPVSASLGLWSFLITYLVSIPLGIAKAVRDGTRFDAVSSTAILVGYSIPGFVLAILLLVVFGGGTFLDWFPLRGLVSNGWSQMPWYARILDYLWHIVLPVICLSIGSLAIMTMLTKNSFLEEIRRQYVITARAKGLDERRVMYGHIFRNAVIPLVTGFPAAFLGAFFTGALLIEKIFSLDGLGLLAYNSVIQRDYPVVLGTLYIFSIVALLGKLLSDLSYVLIDPRIQFEAIDR